MTLPHDLSRRKIGLALGSGGARGWSHLGVLRRLHDLGLRPYCLAGTSIGSIAAALYASGRLDTMEELAARLDWKRVAQLFIEVNFPRSGLLTGRNFMKMLRGVIPAHAISSLRMPYAAVATDIDAGTEVVFTSGSLFTAIRASIGIPGIFTPTRVNGRNLVDGALVNPLPVSVCRALGADFVIAVDINLRLPSEPRPPYRSPALMPSPRIARLAASLARLMPPPPESKAGPAGARPASDTLTIFDILTRAFRLAENQLTLRELERNPPDLLLQPAVGDIMTLDFHRGPEVIADGVRAVDEALPQLTAALSLPPA